MGRGCFGELCSRHRGLFGIQTRLLLAKPLGAQGRDRGQSGSGCCVGGECRRPELLSPACPTTPSKAGGVAAGPPSPRSSGEAPAQLVRDSVAL